MNQPEPFIDIHCHIIPGLDDGPTDWEQSLVMARMAVADGVGAIVATPHQLGNHSHVLGEQIHAQTARIQDRLGQFGISLQLYPGADVRIEPDLHRKILDHKVLTLAGSRYVLLELPHEVYIPLDKLLSDLHAAGLMGILSHPERNKGILNRPDVLMNLKEQGCLLQVTAGSLLGNFGPMIQKFAESMVQKRLVDFVASDAHGTKTRTPVLSHAFNRVASLAGYDAAIDMFCRNPASVITGKQVMRRANILPKLRNLFGTKHLFNTKHRTVGFS